MMKDSWFLFSTKCKFLAILVSQKSQEQCPERNLATPEPEGCHPLLLFTPVYSGFPMLPGQNADAQE